MKIQRIATFFFTMAITVHATARPAFEPDKDLLIAQYDSKPDPDDLHAQAAAGCMLNHPDWQNVTVFAVAGAYGIQKGKYMDSSSLFSMAFGEKNKGWTDAHKDWDGSVKRIKSRAEAVLKKGGKVWVAEAGQSNITADWVKALIDGGMNEAIVKKRVIVVQHSLWNENQTDPADLDYVKSKTDYFALDDGNAPFDETSWGDRGAYSTPEYRSKNAAFMKSAKASSNKKAAAYWTEAERIIDHYYPEGFPHEWSFIKPGGVDFSDTVEIWWILEDAVEGNGTAGFWKKYVTP
ncbi:hypothetical protein P9H32_07690 [Pontiella sp. NLcol2]|uniref:Uncharacterized protein n=2 Tax=Pontiella agarivorans TaxID=3038953 RepID=A0ABU5MWG9_9BACT|nr:hypothetical protein [Pontiella agarivorans]